MTSTLDHSSENLSYLRTSSPGVVRQSLGGVGRNIAEVAFRLGVPPLFISTVGKDLAGKWLLEKMEEIGMATDGLQVVDQKSTAVYNAIHGPEGELLCAVADMDFDHISKDKVSGLIKVNKPRLVCFDGNISVECMRTIVEACHTLDIPALFEPTSTPKSLKIFQDPSLRDLVLSSNTLRYISPNEHELRALYDHATKQGLFETTGEWFKKLDEFNIDASFRQDVESFVSRNSNLSFLTSRGIIVQAIHLLPYFENILIKLGEHGSLLAQSVDIEDSIKNSFSDKEIIVRKRNRGILKLRYFEPIKIPSDVTINVTGAGDSFIGTFAAGIVQFGEKEIDKVIYAAHRAAALTLESQDAVSQNIGTFLFDLINNEHSLA